MALIDVENITFKYSHGKRNAVDGISFSVERGAYLSVLGFNGSGKSTLARLLCGLEIPDSGSIKIAENARIGIVFQNPKNQIVSGLISRDTAFGPRNLGLSESETELRVIESLNVVDLLDRAQSPTNALSLGQTQKVALSGVIAMRPEILILDEALSMLDPNSRSEIMEFIKYWHRCGNTIIQITHEEEVFRQSDTVLGMEDGKIFFYGTKDAFCREPENLKRIRGEELPVADKKALKVDLENPTLKIEGLSFSYSGDESARHGIFDINLELYKGTITALAGPSGAGKSTLLEAVAGLLPVEGRILVQKEVADCEKSPASIEAVDPDCVDASTTTDKILRPALAQQNATAALFEAFAVDDVAFGPRNKGIAGKTLKKLVETSMNQAGIPFDEFKDRRTFELSGGEQRRLSIAGILAMDSNVLLFDEPAAGLDSRARRQIMLMMRELANQGKTILFSTHHLDECDFADRVIQMRDGKVVYDSLDMNVSEDSVAGVVAAGMAEISETEDESVGVTEVSVPNLGMSESVTKVSVENLQPLQPFSSVGLLQSLRKTTYSFSKPGKTCKLQKLHPAWRILLFLALFIGVLCLRPWWACLAGLFVSFLYCHLASLKPKRLVSASLKILPFLLFFSIFQMIFHPALPGEVHWTQWKWFMVTPSKVLFCISSILRTEAALALITGFFVSTPDYDFIDGLKILLKPLALIKIPVRYLILIMELTFRFIPLLVEECQSIIKTQLIRGGLGEVKGRLAKIKAFIPLIVPLIIQTIKRSDALADAITMRAFK